MVELGLRGTGENICEEKRNIQRWIGKEKDK